MLAFIVPIMYLDHVTDGILKGIGEQVYSMWVNITDSLLSVILVYFLIPPLGIIGYAIVIVVMEGYNFALSALRLRGRIRIKINVIRSAILPVGEALVSAMLANRLLPTVNGESFSLWLILKMIFALATFVFLHASSKIILKQKKKKYSVL